MQYECDAAMLAMAAMTNLSQSRRGKQQLLQALDHDDDAVKDMYVAAKAASSQRMSKQQEQLSSQEDHLDAHDARVVEAGSLGAEIDGTTTRHWSFALLPAALDPSKQRYKHGKAMPLLPKDSYTPFATAARACATGCAALRLLTSSQVGDLNLPLAEQDKMIDVLQTLADDAACLVTALALHKGLVKHLLRGGVLGALGSVLGVAGHLEPRTSMRAAAALRSLSASPAVRFELGMDKAAPLLDSIVKHAQGTTDGRDSTLQGTLGGTVELQASITGDGSASEGAEGDGDEQGDGDGEDAH